MNHYDQYKKFKRNLILKYKKTLSRTSTGKILDSFVSINDFLAVEMSKGPDEPAGNINYFYDITINFYNFFTILVEYYGFNEVLCMPKFILKYKNNIDITAIAYLVDIDELIVPVDLFFEIKDCMKTNKRFVYFQLSIDSLNEDASGHENVFIMDLYKKTIERFEPFGFIDEQFEKNIDNVIKTRLLKFREFKNFTYLTPFDISIEIGPQAKADAYGGMCVTYCMLYLQLRIMNPDIIQKELVTYLTKMNKKKLLNIILRYAKFIELTLKKYDFQVHKQDDYVFKKAKSKQKYISLGKKGDFLLTF